MSSISLSQQEQLNIELWRAARDGDIKKNRQVLARGARLNYQNVIGPTALHYACIKKHPAFVRFLLDNKADINILTNDNDTPLHYACLSGSLSCAQQVVEAGCDTEIRNDDGETAMETAASRGHTDIVNYLSTHSKNQKIQMDTFNSAIKSKGKRTQVLAHATFQGNARSGKISLFKVPSGESANLHQTSTGVADKQGVEKVSLPETSSGSPTTLTDSHPQRISNPEGIVHHGGAHHSSWRCCLL